MVFGIVGCSMPQEEKEEIAIIACNIMGESRNMDGVMRIKEINAAREKIGEEAFLSKDDVIKESFIYGLCKELVLNDVLYREKLAAAKAIEEAQRIEEAIIAEEERIEFARIAEEERIEEDKRLGEVNESLMLGLDVYEVGAYTSEEATALIKKYNDNGFPAFTQANKDSDELVDLLIGPFASEQDIQTNITMLNQISGVAAGKIVKWNP